MRKQPLRHLRSALALFAILASVPMLESGVEAGWGPRFGMADDPDQFLLGLQWDGGLVAPRLAMQPNLKLGLGSNRKSFLASVPLHYRLTRRSRATPYFGGAVTAGMIDRDGADSDMNFELAIDGIAGLEWRIGNGRRFALELNLGFGDLHDLVIFAGWTLP